MLAVPLITACGMEFQEPDLRLTEPVPLPWEPETATATLSCWPLPMVLDAGVMVSVGATCTHGVTVTAIDVLDGP